MQVKILMLPINTKIIHIDVKFLTGEEEVELQKRLRQTIFTFAYNHSLVYEIEIEK